MSLRAGHSPRAALAIACLAPWGAAVAQSLADPELRLEFVAAPFHGPVSLAFLGPDDFIVVRRADGLVLRVLDGVLLADPVLDLPVHSQSERGGLGLATDPDFVNNGFVYVFYTESPTGTDTVDPAIAPLGNRVYRYRWNGTALVEPALILDLPVLPGPNHNGGVIDFGPDDMLYAVIGDLNRFGQLQNIAGGAVPDDTSVILRVRPDGSVPPDNPFRLPGQPAGPMDRYYAYGIRNSFGFGFDPLTGTLWNTENGPGEFDEINRVDPGFNSGWVRIMGPAAETPGGLDLLWTAPGSAYADPAFAWRVPVAPTAVAFVASRRLGCDLEHDMLVADFNCGQIYRFDLDASRVALVAPMPELADGIADNTGDMCLDELGPLRFGEDFFAVTDIVNGPDGRLYVVAFARGLIFRISRLPGSVPDADGDEVEDACDCDPANAGAWAEPLEVPRLRVRGSPTTTLGWDSQTGTTGTGSTSTVASGDLDALRAGESFASACALVTGLAETRLTDPRPAPPPGEAYYYLVRTGNACGAGSYGDTSPAPDARDALDAANLPPCGVP